MSCPHTSPQNGKAERIIRSTNNIMRSHLFQASIPPSYWVEALHAATYLMNRHPTKTLSFSTPYHALYGTKPSYNHLRVFGCLCYPNLSATAPHKLAPRSTPCVFLGYPSEHKGYRCLDLSTNRLIISRHVTFDETSFPFSRVSSPPSSDFDFLSEFDVTYVPPIGSPLAGTVPAPAGPATPVAPAQAAASGPLASHVPRHVCPVAAPVQQVVASNPGHASGSHDALQAPAVLDAPAPWWAPPRAPRSDRVRVARAPPAGAALPGVALAAPPPNAVAAPPTDNVHGVLTRDKRGF